MLQNAYGESLFKGIFDTALDAIITISEQGIVETFNPAAEMLFGYFPDEVVGKNVNILMPEPYAHEHDNYLKRYLVSGNRKIIGFGREVRGKKKDGTIFPMHLAVSEALLDNRRVFVGFSRDISDLKNAEERLRVSESRANAILNTAVDGIVTINEKGTIQSINIAVKRLFQYDEEELIGKPVNVLMPSPYCEEHDEYLHRYMKTGQRKVIGIGREVVARRRDGSIFPMLLSVSEFRLGEERYFTGIIRDISAIKQTEEELKKNNVVLEEQNWVRQAQVKLHEIIRGEKSRQLLCQDILKNLVDIVSADVGIFYLVKNNELSFIAGIAFPADKKNGKVLQMGEGLSGQAAIQDEVIFVEGKGEAALTLEASTHNVLLNSVIAVPLSYEGRVLGVIELGSTQVISEKAVTFLKQIREAIGIGINVLHNREQLTLLLEETQSQAEALQRQQEELKAANEELSEKSNTLQRQQEEMEQINEELEEQRSALEEQRENLEKNNQILVAAQHELSNKSKALEEESRYKSEFLANMSHELRTPLNSILILSQLLMENRSKLLGEKELEFSKTIYGSGSDLLLLINDILDLSKIEANRLEVNHDEVLTGDIIQHLSNLFSPLAKNKKIDLFIKAEDDFPEKFESDEMRLEQILKNLVGNAIKFTDKGAVTIRLCRPEKEDIALLGDFSEKSALKFEVSDTGIGIPEDKFDIIFDAFKQVDGGTSRTYGGSGLGLAIAKKITQLFGGAIQVKSQLGKGSTFSLVIPEKMAKTSSDSSVNVQKFKEGLNDDRNCLGENKKTILIISDDVESAKILLDSSRKEGFQCLVSFSETEGVQDANQFIPDAIVLDLNSSESDKVGMVKTLKSGVKTRYIPVHIISDSLEKLNTESSLKVEGVLKKISLDLKKKKIKVLVLDDNERELSAIKSYFSEIPAEVFTSKTVNEAISILEKDSIDVVVLDLLLKNETGFDLLKRISGGNAFELPHIIIYTAKELLPSEQEELSRFSNTIILKGESSAQRLLDEVSSFLGEVKKVMKKSTFSTKKSISKDEGKPIVLMVDDDNRNLFSLEQALGSLDLEMITASNGEEAIRAFKEVPNISLILMDMMMPVVNGYEATEAIRKMDKTIPIIALTAKAMKGDREKCLNSGCTDYLSKPVDINQLVSLVKVWLNRNL